MTPVNLGQTNITVADDSSLALFVNLHDGVGVDAFVEGVQ
jgi:hypothetical protein